MRRRWDYIIIASIGLMAAVLAVDGAIALSNLRQLNEHARLVAETHEVRELTADVLQSLLDAETGQRGFILTGREEYLEPYAAALAQADEKIARLKEATRGNPLQQARVEVLEQSSRKLLETLRDGIEHRVTDGEQGSYEDAVDQAKQHMDAIRALEFEIRREETELLSQRQVKASRAYDSARWSIIGRLIFGLAAVAGLAMVVQRGIHSREQAANAIFQERERLRVTMSSIADAVIATDMEGRVTLLNSVAETMTGWKSDEARGRSLDEVFTIVSEDDERPVESPVSKSLREGVIVGLANHTILIGRDGMRYPIEDSAAPIRDVHGGMIGTVLVFHDVTAQREKQRVQAERARLTNLRADVGLAVARTDELGVVLSSCCESVVRNLRASTTCVWLRETPNAELRLAACAADDDREASDEVAGIEPQYHPRVQTSLIERIAEAGDAYFGNGELAAEVGEPACSFAGFPLMVEGRAVGVLAVTASQPLSEAASADMAMVCETLAQCIERRRAELQRQRIDARFKTLANSIPQLAWMVRPDGDVFWYNQRWYDYTGTTLDEMRGWGWQAVHDPRELPRVVEKLKRSFESGEPWEDIFPLRRHDGQFRWHLSRMMPLRDESGNIVMWFGTNTDVTEQREAEAALRESEQRFRQLADAMPQIVWVCRADGYTAQFNERWYNYTGCVGDECLGDGWVEWLHPDDRQATRELWQAAVHSGERYEIEYRFRGRDGSYRWFLSRAVPVRNDDNEIVQWCGTSTDIDDRKRDQQRLTESQQFLRSSLDALSSHIAVLDETGVILAVNEAWRRFGERNGLVTPYYAVGHNYLTACEPQSGACEEHASEASDGIREVIVGKRRNYLVEYPCHSPTEKRWFQMRVTPFHGISPTRVVVAHEDITHRVLAEQATQRRSEQLECLADIVARLNAARDVSQVLEIVAEGARDTIGAHQAVSSLTLNENWAQSINAVSLSDKYAEWRDFDVQPNGQGIYALVCQRARSMRLTQAELEAHPAWHAFGQYADQHPPMRGWLAAPMIDSDGENLGVLQLSDRYEGEFTRDDEAILNQMAQVASVAIENSRLYQDLKAADRRKDEFLATLAHELRNPLSPLSAAAQLLNMEPNDSEQVRELSTMITRQCEQLKRLIDDLLDVSRIATGKLYLQHEPLNLREAISAGLDISRPVIEAAGHSLEVRVTEEPLFVQGDRVRLAQVIGNLLINAAKYTPSGGRIELEAAAETVGDARVACIRVRDNGIGIPREMLSTIFGIFTQVDSSHTRAQGGLGIGLTLVKTLVDLHDGTVAADSAGLNRGSEFTVRLPLIDAPVSSPATEQPNDSDSDAIATFRVLIVDDNRSSSYLLKRLLEKLNQQVRVADSATAALDILPQFHPQVIISDIAMPGMTGYELASRIRQMKLTPPPRLIALTGYGQATDRQQALQAGFDDHMVKPVGLPALRQLFTSWT
ncbi:MAG: PAS domain S-box protein [Planctomycetales bacterium]|nr:PAS domain S-box protein [Planctomycetales bacterium]